MAKDEPTKPVDGSAGADPAPMAETDDTEGHSMGLLMGLNAVGRAQIADARSRSRKVPEEELPRLSKKWPSMRDEKKG